MHILFNTLTKTAQNSKMKVDDCMNLYLLSKGINNMIIDKVYKVSAFGDFTDIKATTENMMFLLETFKTYGLIPTLTTEFNITASIDGSQAPVQNQVQRLALISNDNSEQIMIGTNRIDYTITATSDIKFVEENFIEFNKKIIGAFSEIFKQFNKKANRIALNTESLIVNLTNDEIVNLMSKFTNPLSMYQKELDEWNTHLMIRCDEEIEQLEKINVITNLSKIIYNKVINEESIPEIGFLVQMDINTIAENITQRFTTKNIEKFINIAHGFWNNVIDELKEKYEK